MTGLGLALVVLVGSLLRFVGLGKESIWLDEATSIIIARMNLTSVVAWAAGDIHPPLYYLALHFWLRLGETEFAVRALSAVFGILTIVVVYALANELFGARIGLLSALLLALSPLHIWYSQEARMYVMVTALGLLASYMMLLALRKQQMRLWLGYVLVSALALYTHYFALFALLFQNLYALCCLRRTSPVLRRRWLVAQLMIALLFLPWLPVLYHQVTTGGGGWVERSVGRPSLYALVDTWLYFSVGLDSQLYPVMLRRTAYVMFGLGILTAVLRMRRQSHIGSRAHPRDSATRYLSGEGQTRAQFNREREGTWFCLGYVALPVLTAWLLSQAKPMYSIRYLLPFLPPYCILLAKGIDSVRWNRARIVVALSLVLTLLVGNWNGWRVEQNADWRGVASHVLAQARPGDVVLFSPRWNEKPFDYYNRGRLDINMDLPIPVTVDAAQKVVEGISHRYQRVWLVWTRGHYSDPDGIVNHILDSRWQTVEARDFRGVDTLILYDMAEVNAGS
jgi:mannosyltransferase